MPGDGNEVERERRTTKGSSMSSLPRLTNRGSIRQAKKVEFGSGSVFDAEVVSAEKLPYKLPIPKYLEEVSVGMCGAPDSFDTPEKPEQARMTWRQLKRVAGTENARNVCENLAWIAIGVIFGTVAEAAIEELRARLSRSWFLLTIDLGRTEFVGGVAVGPRDVVLDMLPTYLVQAILRLIVDAFPQDQMELVRNIEVIIDKLTCIVHKEVWGFPLNRETSVSLRRQLFRRKVLEKPHVNLVETIQSEKRLTVMENAQAQLRPLRFGSKSGRAQALEEQQLEHVLEHRVQQQEHDHHHHVGRRTSSKTHSGAAEGSSLQHRAQLLRQCVDSYQGLSSTGEELLARHLDQIYPERERSEEQVTPPETPPSDHHQEAQATMMSQSTEMRSSFYTSRQTMSSSRRSFCLTATATTATATMRVVQERREAEKAKRKKREELLSSRIAAPLPEAFAFKHVERSWVSPIISRQLGSEESSPAPSRKWSRKAHGSQSSSLPDFKLADEALPEISGLGPAGAASLASAAAAAAAAVAAAGKEGGRRRCRRQTILGIGRSCADSSQGSRISSPTMQRRENYEAIDLNAQHSIEGQEILKRLEQQREAISQNSFDAYKKEFDLATGIRRQKLDGAKIRQQELQYVESLHALVGSRSEPALRLPKHRPSRPHPAGQHRGAAVLRLPSGSELGD